MSTAEITTPPENSHQPNWAPAQRIAFLCAVIGFAVLIGLGLINLGAADDSRAHIANGQIFTSLLVGYIFWISLPVGGMALLFIHYVVKTSWGLLIKRFLEAATRTLPLFVALFLVIGVSLTFGKSATYWWVNPQVTMIEPRMHDSTARVNAYEENPLGVAKPTAEDFFLYQKAKAITHELQDRDEGNFGFLSIKMFFIVGLVLFAIWYGFIHFMNKWSVEADDPNKVLASLEKANKLGGPGLIIFAITITAAATQWVMSLEASWASTMFPVIFAVNSFLTCFAFCLALFLTMAEKPPLKTVLRDKFQIDMGTLLLAFTLFWSYTSFSQMMLVWIGNLPEEIPFYLKRSMPTYGFWWCVSAGLIALHFFLPFLLLLFRDIKLHPKRLRAVALYLLVICAIDVTWWIEPSLNEGFGLYLLMDLGAIVGVGGLFGLFFLYEVKKRPILATNETYLLPEGHSHHE